MNIDDITDNAIFIRKPEKGEPARAIPVAGKPIEVIRSYIKYFRMRTDQRALFTGPSGRINSDALRTRVKRLCTNAGVPRLHTHLFRHWFATTEYKITEKVEIVQKLLGHKDIKSTYRYIHSDTYELSKFAAPLLNAAIEAINQGKLGSDLRANTTIRGEGESNPRSHRETA